MPAGQQEPAASGPRLDPAGVDRQQALPPQTAYPHESQQLTPEVPPHPGVPAPAPAQGETPSAPDAPYPGVPAPAPAQREMPSAPDAPRLWDFPLLRLPIPELVIGGIMISSVLRLSGSDNPGAGLFVLFIFVPSFAFYLAMYALTIPLHFRPVNEFWGDLIALAPGVFGLLIVAKGGEGIFFMATLPIAISLLLRRLIA